MPEIRRERDTDVPEERPDWHSLGAFDPESQARFILEAAQGAREYELALIYAELRGVNPIEIQHFPFKNDIEISEECEGEVRSVENVYQGRYEAEETRIRKNFFSLTPQELHASYQLRFDRSIQEKALGRLVIQLKSLDSTMAKRYQELQEAVGRDGAAVACFRKAHRTFADLIRNIAGKPALELTNEAELIESFPDLAPWIRDHIIHVGVHADDESHVVVEIERDIYFLLFLMVRTTIVFLRGRRPAYP